MLGVSCYSISTYKLLSGIDYTCIELINVCLPSSGVWFICGGLGGPEPTIVTALTDTLYIVNSSKPPRMESSTGPLVVNILGCCSSTGEFTGV